MKGIVQAIAISAVILALAGHPATGDGTKNQEFFYEYLTGHYIAIGKELNSDHTYIGKVVFSYENGRFTVMREIQGTVLKGEGRIEQALGHDTADVLRVRFVRAGQQFEITYLWRSDLDNYARLSG